MMSQNKHPADFLSNPKRYYSNFSLVQNTLQHFTPDNSLMILRTCNVNISSNLSTQVNFDSMHEEVHTQSPHEFPIPLLDHVEPIRNTPFTIYLLPLNLMKYWTSITGTKELHLAIPNPYIPKLISNDQRRAFNILSRYMYNVAITVWTLPRRIRYNFVNIRCYFTTKTSFTSPYQISKCST